MARYRYNSRSTTRTTAMLYDHISLHLDEHYPPGLPECHAAHHIGYYYAWAVSQNLHSEAAAALDGFADMQSGRISGASFVLERLNGGIDTACFNDLGNRFTRYYYADEDEGYGHFMTDYFAALGLETQNDFYRTPDNAACRQRLDAVFQTAFDRWQATLMPSER
ncbi:hypothetical protein V6667_01600 [Neisseria leonii]|uniref:DUF7832 domain-containing protein n=1 Tax=Neisseria leonii TaxID=2995413 RepID=UPI0030D57CF7